MISKKLKTIDRKMCYQTPGFRPDEKGSEHPGPKYFQNWVKSKRRNGMPQYIQLINTLNVVCERQTAGHVSGWEM